MDLASEVIETSMRKPERRIEWMLAFLRRLIYHNIALYLTVCMSMHVRLLHPSETTMLHTQRYVECGYEEE